MSRTKVGALCVLAVAVSMVSCQSQARVESRLALPVTINYSMTLEEMIEAGRYQWVNPYITESNFPIVRQGFEVTKIFVLKFDREMKADEVFARLDALGFKAADLPQLLALGKTYPELQRLFWIVAPGSLWQNKIGYTFVPALLTTPDNERRLAGTLWREGSDDGISSDVHVAAVMK